MAEITAAMVKELRQATGAGIMDCKRALSEADGEFKAAADNLQIKKKATAAKKSTRIAGEGIVSSYIHMGGRIGVMCEVNCETDFVGKTDKFKEFVNNVCMHIAAMNPKYIQLEDFPADAVDVQKQILIAQVVEEGKPEALAEKIVQGKISKWMKEVTLLEQQYVKAEGKESIKDYLENFTGDIGEKISIRRFVRYEMGEGLEKRSENFADEVAAQIG